MLFAEMICKKLGFSCVFASLTSAVSDYTVGCGKIPKVFNQKIIFLGAVFIIFYKLQVVGYINLNLILYFKTFSIFF